MAKLSKVNASVSHASQPSASKGGGEGGPSSETLQAAEKSTGKKSQKVGNVGGGGKQMELKKRKRRAATPTSFKRYIHKVLKVVQHDMSASSSAMIIMDNFVHDFFNRIATEAALLTKRKKSTTLSSRDLQAAIRLLIPGELAKHADSEGTKAVARYLASRK